ncbi:hypothetical protein LI177_06650 [bacterium 210820-DFI.6.37]|nr:hypothetical protein [bacterium 210820-DFI.6.37]
MIRNIDKSVNKKGYITLEAAIFLPIFIIAVLTLAYFIKIYSTAENITYAMLDETSYLASRASGVKSAPFFRQTLKERIEEENHQVENVQVNRFRYLYSDGNQDNLITAACGYRITLTMPLPMADGTEMESRIKCRGFTGLKKAATPMSFDEMERDGVWDPVWIFPMSGKKYHSESCRYVKENAKQMVLTGALKRQYHPCGRCKPETLSVGAYVYCFTDAGRAYHKKSCRQVDKYTVEMDREDARSKGYTPCSKCGGGKHGDSE